MAIQEENQTTAGYRAFLSYSHAADNDLAAFLQSGLQRFAKPWYRRRAIRVFRDTTGLGATPDLWGSIRAALQASQYFILFASERAAQSRWIELELDEWLRIRSPDRLLIVWTDGELIWDSEAGDFDWARSTAVHPRLRGVFQAEPLHVDLRWAETTTELSPRRPEFLDAVARLSATLRGIPVDDLLGEDMRQHKRARRLAGSAVTALVVLLLAAVAAAFFAVRQRDQARDRLVELMVANGARELEGGDLSGSALWFAEALELEPGGSDSRDLQRIRLRSAIESHPRLLHVWAADSSVIGRWVSFGGDGRYVISDGFRGDIDTANQEGAPPRGDAPGVWDTQTGDSLPLTTRVPEDQWVLAVDAMSDRVRLIVGDGAGTARVVDVGSGVELARMAHPAELLSAAFSPDGKTVLTEAGDAAVRLWDAADGELIGTLPHESALAGAGFTTDGRRVLSITEDGRAHIWTLTSDDVVGSHRSIAHDEPVQQVDVTADGRFCITVAGRDARLWDLASPDTAIHLDSWIFVNHAEFSPDGARLLLADDFGEASVLYLDLPGQVTVARPAGAVLHASFSPDGRRFATASTDRVARVWESNTGEPLSPPLYHEETVTHVAFDPGQSHLATATTSGLLRVWELTRTYRALEHESVDHVAYAPDGRYLLSASEWQVKIWQPRSEGAPITVTPGSQVYQASFSPDGRHVVTADADGTARIWESATGREVLSLPHRARVQYASFSRDGARLATAAAGGGDSREITLWDAVEGSMLFSLPLGSDWPTYVEFSADGTRLLTLASGVARVWNLDSGREIEGLQIEEVRSASLSPDGTLLAAAFPGGVRVYDVPDASPHPPLIRHENYMIDRFAFSADSRRLVVVGGGYARLWDARTGTPLTPPLQHGPHTLVLYATTSADNRFLATAARDGSARVWDARTGQPVTPPLMHGSSLRELTFSPDSKRLVSVGDRVRIWDIAPDASGPEDTLALLAKVLSAREIDATGAIVLLTPERFRKAWDRLTGSR